MPVGYTVYPPWVGKLRLRPEVLRAAEAWLITRDDEQKHLVEIICIIDINIVSFVHMDLGNKVIYVSKVKSSFGSLQIFGDLLAMFATYNPTSSKHHRCIHIENSLEVAGSQWTS